MESSSPTKAKRKLLGVVEIIDSRERDRGVPAPWAYRWSWRILVIAVVVYSYYVLIGRLCAPMLQERDDARGSVGEGAGLLVGETFLFLMFCWTYLKVISTSPGIAPELIPRSDPPPALGDLPADIPMSAHLSEEHLSDDNAASAGPLDGGRNLLPAELSLPAFMDSSRDRSQGVSVPSQSRQNLGIDPYGRPAEYAMTGDIAGSVGTRASSHFGNEMNLVGSRESAINLTDHVYPRQDLPPTHADLQAKGTALARAEQPITPSRPFPPEQKDQAYCQYCQIYKPWRSHHCRVCGVCVLGMDHDCPWVGCIGWRNHKFFINFLTWSTLYTIYVLIVLVCKLAQGGSADGQMIGITAVAGFFTLFTSSMLASHIQLISIGMTTIESFSLRSQLDRERAFLTRQFGVCGWFRKRRAMKAWGREWGDLKDEGNRWFVGPSAFDEWKRVMGNSPVTWILPMGHSQGDGIQYEQNPRFASDGSRRRREEWPIDLQ